MDNREDVEMLTSMSATCSCQSTMGCKSCMLISHSTHAVIVLQNSTTLSVGSFSIYCAGVHAQQHVSDVICIAPAPAPTLQLCACGTKEQYPWLGPRQAGNGCMCNCNQWSEILVHACLPCKLTSHACHAMDCTWREVAFENHCMGITGHTPPPALIKMAPLHPKHRADL